MNTPHALILAALVSSAIFHGVQAQAAESSHGLGHEAYAELAVVTPRDCIISLRLAQTLPYATLPRSAGHDEFLQRCQWMIEAARLAANYENLQVVMSGRSALFGQASAAASTAQQLPIADVPGRQEP